MRTHVARSFLAIMATLALPVLAISQQQAPSGGGSTPQNSSQGAPSASGGTGQNSNGRGTQGVNNAVQGGAAQRDSSGDGVNNRSSQQGDSPRTQADGDVRRDATDRGSGRDTAGSPQRRTTNRVDASRDEVGDSDNLDRDQGRVGDRDSRGADRADRDAADRDDDRSNDLRDRDRTTRERGGADNDGERTQRGDGSDSRGEIDFGAGFSTDNSNRVVIRDLQSTGIFGRAGLRDGDVIVSVRGQRVGSPIILRRILFGATGRVPVVILRDGVEQTIYIDDFHRQTRLRTPYGYDEEFYQTDRAWLGVIFDTRYDNSVVVQAVQEGSAADNAGIRAGDRIMGINGRRVQTPAQLSQLIGTMEPGDQVEIDVARWQTRQVEAQLGERPATSSRFRYLEEANAPQGDRAENGNFDRDEDDRRETFRVQP